jgi:chromosome segregation ATPase
MKFFAQISSSFLFQGELHLLTRKSLEQENVSIRDQLSSRDHTVRELQGQLSELEKERDALLVAQSTASGLGLQLQEVQGRNRDLQMELDKASIKAKQQDLALSDANSSVIRLRTELSSVSKQLSELKVSLGSKK